MKMFLHGFLAVHIIDLNDRKGLGRAGVLFFDFNKLSLAFTP